MIDKKIFDDLIERFEKLIPQDLDHLRQDLKQNLRTLLQNNLAKMNLVTREEFDVQSAVLAKTREKLEALELELEKLEQQVAEKK